MPSCCQGATCACKVGVASGGHMSVTGSGSASDPFLFSADVALGVNDNPVFDLTLTGSGDSADPWVLNVDFATTAKLDNLPDVNAPSPTNGQVLGYNASTQQWVAQAATTAPTGAVQHGPALSGDGSAGNPLLVVPDANRLMQTSATGVGLSNTGMADVVQHFADATARAAMSPAPVLNQLTTLAINPGRVDYWTGSAWAQITDQITMQASSAALLQISGPYVAGNPVTQYLKSINLTADANGVITLLGSSDLTGRAGVLDCMFQETGMAANPVRVFVNTSGSTVTGIAYKLTDATPAANAVITGTVRAYLY